MESKKNTPPKGIFVALGIIFLLVVFYFVLTAIFPDLFHAMNTGTAAPVK